MMPRPDPRVDPESLAPPPEKSARRRDPRVDPESLVPPARPDPRVDPASLAPPPEPEPEQVQEQVGSATIADPRVAAVEPLVDANDWRAVAAKLGPLADAGDLPPNLGLIAAMAHNEMAREGSDEARDLATRCTGAVLGVAPESVIARVVARRLLRKNPVRFRERPAPPPRTSAIIIVIGLVVSILVGLIASGELRVLLRAVTR